MSHQLEFVTRMRASTPLMTLMTGGAYAAEELPPEEAISAKFELTKTAFDLTGGQSILKPCSLVRNRDTTPDGIIMDNETQLSSAFLVMMVHLYQHRGYDVIDQMVPLVKQLFIGRPYTGVIDIMFAGAVERARDGGALMGNSLERLDFQVILVS